MKKNQVQIPKLCKGIMPQWNFGVTKRNSSHPVWYVLMHTVMTSSNGNVIHVTDPLCGEFTGPGEFPTQKPVTRSFDVFFDLRLNKRLSKPPWGWWFETPSWPLWRQCNASANCFLVMAFGYLRRWTLAPCLGYTVFTFRPRQNGRRFADDTFKRVFFN